MLMGCLWVVIGWLWYDDLTSARRRGMGIRFQYITSLEPLGRARGATGGF